MTGVLGTEPLRPPLAPQQRPAGEPGRPAPVREHLGAQRSHEGTDMRPRDQGTRTLGSARQAHL